MFSSFHAFAVDPPQGGQTGVDIQQRQDEQQRRVRAQANERPDELQATRSNSSIDLATLTRDKPCFQINEVHLSGNAFDWLPRFLAPVRGQCIGKSALKQIQDAANNELIRRGYITSRVLMPQQNLGAGLLTLQVVPGRVGQIRVDSSVASAIGTSRPVIPTHPGEIYNQRDIDQAIESIRRLAGQADTSVDLVPGNEAGVTDIVVKPAPAKRWHVTLGADNYGMNTTGRTELNGSLTIDSPFFLYDQLTLSGNTSAHYAGRDRGAHSDSLNWNIPVGYASLFASASQSHYVQTSPGFGEPLINTGDTTEVDSGFSFVPFRNASTRTGVSVSIFHKMTTAELNGEALNVQHRDVTGFEFDLSATHYMGRAVLSGSIGWRGTLGGLTKDPGLVLDDPAWDGRERMWVGNLQLSTPVAGLPIQYVGSMNFQRANSRLVPNDDFVIGTPYSVRGFDGQYTLAAESGWAWRNELNTSLWNQQPFVALDAGRVYGPNTRYLTGTELIGTALGVRGRLPWGSGTWLGAFNYQISAGWALKRPDAMPGGHPNVMAQLSADL